MDTDFLFKTTDGHGWTRIILVTTDGHGWEFQLVKQVSPVETTKEGEAPEGASFREMESGTYLSKRTSEVYEVVVTF
jgi:hypothetical protein